MRRLCRQVCNLTHQPEPSLGATTKPVGLVASKACLLTMCLIQLVPSSHVQEAVDCPRALLLIFPSDRYLPTRVTSRDFLFPSSSQFFPHLSTTELPPRQRPSQETNAPDTHTTRSGGRGQHYHRRQYNHRDDSPLLHGLFERHRQFKQHSVHHHQRQWNPQDRPGAW